MPVRKLTEKELREQNRGTDPVKIAEKMAESVDSLRWQTRFCWVAQRIIAGKASKAEVERFNGDVRNVLLRAARAKKPASRSAIIAEYIGDNGGLAELFATVTADDPDPDAVSTGKDLIAALPNVRFLWKPFIPRGMVSMIIAAPGLGKTAFALGALVRAVVKPCRWPDGKTGPAKAGKVMYVDTECTQAVVADRLRVWNIAADRIILPKRDVLDTLKIDDDDDVDILRETVRVHKPEMVVIDSLRGSHRMDENNSGVVEVMESLAALARDSNVAIVVVHHTRKVFAGEKVTADTARGSNALTAIPRSVIAMDKPDSKSEWIRVSVVKSNVAKLPEPFGVLIKATGLQFGPAPVPSKEEKEPSALDKAMEFLKAFLAKKPRLAKDAYEAAGKQGIAAATLRRARKELGVVTPKGGKSTWSLPAAKPAQKPTARKR